jgi:hypothetical protein
MAAQQAHYGRKICMALLYQFRAGVGKDHKENRSRLL